MVDFSGKNIYNEGGHDFMRKQLKTAVLLTFFVKYNTLERVFAMIRKVQPPILFLACDGARSDHPDDVENIRKCKQIVENIDWECDVHRYYQTENKGILYNGNYACRNAFEIVDRLIFLEDDKLPTESFFFFCEELLEKYKDDERVYGICGGNHCGIYENCEADYFFVRYPYSGASGIWKRSFENIDRSFSFLEDSYTRECVEYALPKEQKNKINRAIIARRDFLKDGMPKSSELASTLEFYLQNRCNIYPKYNMIVDIGCAKGSEHFPDDIRKVPKVYQKSIMDKSYDIDHKLIHPKYVIPDRKFEEELLKRGNRGSAWRELMIKIETFFRYWHYGSLEEAIQKLKKYVIRKIGNRTDKNGL